jgi:uncharacterized protein (TIGR02996 family)
VRFFTTGVFGPTARIPWPRVVSLCMARAGREGLERVLASARDLRAWMNLHREATRARHAFTMPVTLGTAGRLFLLNDVLGNSLPLVGVPQRRLHHRLRIALRRALFLPADPRYIQGPGEAAFMLAVHDSPADVVNWMAYADWLVDQVASPGPAAGGRARGLAVMDWLRGGQSPLPAKTT